MNQSSKKPRDYFMELLERTKKEAERRDLELMKSLTVKGEVLRKPFTI